MPRTSMLHAAAVFLLLAAAVSCTGTRSREVHVVLSAADSLMMSRPVAALDTLRSLDSAALSRLSGKQKMYFTLLMAEAKYKCWMPVAEDTAIFRAARYFKKHGQKLGYARALMMSGAVLQESGHPVYALEAYKEAEPVLAALGDYEQTGLLHTRIGELYQSTFIDKEQAVRRYRRAIECFEKGRVYCRLAPAYLSLARILLADSTEKAQPYINRGLKYAQERKDTVWIAVGSELLSWYYLNNKKYQEAVRTAEKAMQLLDVSPQKSKEQLATAAVFGYIGMNKTDSAKALLPLLSLKNLADTATYLGAEYQIAKAEYNLKIALMLKDSLSVIEKELLKKGQDADLERMEQYYNILYENQKLEGRNTRNILYFLAILLCVVIAGFVIQARYVSIISNQKRELIETSNMFLQISDKLLHTYLKFHQPDNFYSNISDLINEMFKGNEIKVKAIHLADILYPGFLSYMKKKYSVLNENDLLIIALEICGLSTKSMTVISGRSEGSLYTAKNRIAQKTGCSVSFSDFINNELSSFTN